MPDSDANSGQAPEKKRLLLVNTPKRFRSAAGVRRFVAQVIWTLERGGPHLDTDTARVMLYGAKILAELIAHGEVEERLSMLEERVYKPESRPSTPGAPVQ